MEKVRANYRTKKTNMLKLFTWIAGLHLLFTGFRSHLFILVLVTICSLANEFDGFSGRVRTAAVALGHCARWSNFR